MLAGGKSALQICGSTQYQISIKFVEGTLIHGKISLWHYANSMPENCN
jgi:hypothetical protein